MASGKTTRQRLPFKDYITWGRVSVVGGVAVMIISPLLASGWLNSPPKAHEMASLKEDTERQARHSEAVDRRLEELTKSTGSIAQSVAAIIASQAGVEKRLDDMSASTNAGLNRLSNQVDAIIPFVLAQRATHLSPVLPPHNQNPHRKSVTSAER
jgi:hypothetical protein